MTAPLPPAGGEVRSGRGRSVALTVVAWLVVAVCLLLGAWQWNRGNVVLEQAPASRPVLPVEQVVSAAAAPGTAQARLSQDEVGRRVLVRGAFDPAVELLVPGREVAGSRASWVLGVVRLDDGTGVAVVRGWVPEGAAVPVAPSGAVEVVGAVQPPENSDVAPSTAALPDGQVWVVSAADLVNRVDYPVATAYVTASGPVAAEGAVGSLRAVPPADPGSATRRLDWRNLAYAAQWWVFALFAVVLWRRALRDLREPPAGPAEDPAAAVSAPPRQDRVPAGAADPGTAPPGGRDVSTR